MNGLCHACHSPGPLKDGVGMVPMQPTYPPQGAYALPVPSAPTKWSCDTCVAFTALGDGGWVRELSLGNARWLRHRTRSQGCAGPQSPDVGRRGNHPREFCHYPWQKHAATARAAGVDS
eukprot:5052805-Pleurochrysis_carterae.AAC.1